MAWGRFLSGLLLLATAIAAACLDDRVVAPDDVLPPDMAIDRPLVQLFRYARGRKVSADTVRITNNGEGPLGTVHQVGGVDYVTSRRVGWLDAEVLNTGTDEALLVLAPVYAEEAQEEDDVAEIVLKAQNSPELRYVTVTARTLPGARFEFSVSPLAFASAPGAPLSTQRITVRNGGNGTLAIHPPEIQYVDGPGGWLTVSPAGGSPTAPEFEVRADPTSLLSGGLFLGRLHFSSPPHEATRAKPADLEVQLNVGQPQLDVSAPSVAFTVIRGEGDPEPEEVVLSNGGAGPFEALGEIQVGAVAYDSLPHGWLHVGLVSPSAVEILARTESLPPGEYDAAFAVVSENGDAQPVQVSLTVETPILTPNPGTVSFGIVEGDTVLPGGIQVAVTNTGSGIPASLGSLGLGTARPEAPWLSGTLDDHDLALALTPSAPAMGVGSHTTRLPVSSEFGGEAEVEVVLSVSRGADDPVLALSATEVEFGGVRGDPSPPPRTVRITNAGGGSLGALSLGTVAYQGETGWLSATLADSTLTLAATTGALPEGTHRASVPVSSRGGGDGSVAVSFVIGAPVLTASALSVDFSVNAGGLPPPPQQVRLSNTGPGSFSSLGGVTVGLPSDPSWLAASLSGQDLTFSVTGIPGGDGVYPSSVPVSSQEGGSLTIQATLTVVRNPDAPDLVASPEAVTMRGVVGGTSPPGQTVLLTNGGGGSLGTLGVSESSPWLSTSGPGTAVTLSAQTASLSAGTYQTAVTFTSANGGNESTEVTLVMGTPVLTLSSEAASFRAEEGGSASPSSLLVDVTNTGIGGLTALGTVSLGPYGGGGWLNAVVTPGGDGITLSASPGGLVPGTYTETVPVNSSHGGSGSVEVTLTVTPEPEAPEMQISSTNLAFFAEASEADPPTRWVPVSNAGGGGFDALAPLSLGAVDYQGGPTGWLDATVDGEAIRLDIATGSTPVGIHTGQVTVSPSAGGSETLTVQFTVSAGAGSPDLELGADQVTFHARFGRTDPPQRTVAIANAGTGSLGDIDVGPISYGQGASGWLSDTQHTGTEVTLVPRTGNLAAGTYTATLPVSSANGGAESLDVTFRIENATLDLETSAVTFASPEGGQDPPGQAVEILNIGSGAFPDLGNLSVGPVTYSPPAGPWLQASLGSQAVELRATTGTLAPGVYEATVPVSSSLAGGKSLAVAFTIRRAGTPPDLVVSPPTVRLDAVLGGADPPPRTLQIANGGGGDLGTLDVLESTPWLTASPPGATTTLQAEVGAMGAGSYPATVQVTSANGGSETVDVTLVVAEPILTLSTAGLSFTGIVDGGSPPSRAVTVSNTGAGAFPDLGDVSVGTIAYGAGATGWLVTPSPGTPVGSGPVDVAVSLEGLAPGTYQAELPILSEHGGDQSVTVNVSVIRETEPPHLVLSTGELRFGALLGGEDPEAEQVYASNAGGGTLGTLQVGPPSYEPGGTGWLTAAESGGVVTVSATTRDLASGEYMATLPVVSAHGGSETVQVALVVGAPRLTITPNTVTFGDTVAGSGPPSAEATLENTGGGTYASLGALSLEPTVFGEGALGWLTATLEGASLDLSASTNDLVSRREPYRARIPVESQFGGADTVIILFSVAPGTAPSELALSVDSLTFGAVVGSGDPPPQTVTAFNGGGGELGALEIRGITYSEGGQGWLSHSREGSIFTFQPSCQGLAGGSYRASVVVGSERGGEIPMTVGLELSQPVLSLSTASVTFSDTVGSPDTLRSSVFLANTGGGNRASLGEITLQPVAYPEGQSGWLSTDPEPGQGMEGYLVRVMGRARGMEEGSSLGRIVVRSEWGGTDTVLVAFSVRRPDRSFDLPTIELVGLETGGGPGILGPLPGDSTTASAAPGSTGQLGLRVGVRNGSETRITLSGLRVGIPSYPGGQPSGWITGAFLDRTTATFAEPAELALAIDPSGLAEGRYEAFLVVSSETPGLEEVEPRILQVVLRIA